MYNINAGNAVLMRGVKFHVGLILMNLGCSIEVIYTAFE